MTGAPAGPAREDRRRSRPENKPEQRAEFQRDRDRILYIDASRRLAGVTQVAGAAEGHLFHNRLTHTLKVAQIARRLAEMLLDRESERAVAWGGLSPDVVETAALIHDLGHPPFGHIAEEELDELAREHGAPDGFEGNAQSFRIVTRLAAHRDPERGDGYEGLNLTRATLNASLKYPRLRDVENPGTKAWRKYGAYDSDQDALKFARELGPPGDGQALEAAIMDYADDVAYSVHDLEDFFRAGLIPITLLSKDRNVFAAFIDAWCADPLSSMTAERVAPHRDTLLRMLEDLFPFDAGYRDTFEHRASLRTASSSLIQRCVWEAHIAAPGSPQPLDIAEEIRVQLKFLQRLVWAHVIQNPRLATQQHGQRQIIRTLFEIYLGAINVRNRALVPPLFHRPLAKLGASAETATRKSANTPEETRLAVDIIASFSDDQAILLYRRLTGVATGSVTDYLAS